ncbi:MAG TPA: hypothetical protein VGY56_04355 [Verrucomicrobiae bacterium]|nr:hypothetical protein [Verrucomicrobiae bacterium]
MTITNTGQKSENESVKDLAAARILIDGKEFDVVYMEKDAQGRFSGVVTTERTFWMHPVCGLKGEAVEPLPSVPPREIYPVSFYEGIAPRSFIRRLQREWQAYRKEWMASRLSNWIGI